MQKSKLLLENGIVVGNIEDKQNLKNPLARLLVHNFNRTISRMIRVVNPTTVLELGCGEGAVTRMILENSAARILSTDISESVLRQAETALCSERVSFECINIYDTFDKSKYAAELVICCEVLEHLSDPLKGLSQIQTLASPYCLISVPREPVWRVMNFLRGAYVSDWGNTPGHFQHWSKGSFRLLIEPFFETVAFAAPLPWLVVLGRVRS